MKRKTMKYYFNKALIYAAYLVSFLFAGCNQNLPSYTDIKTDAKLYPDYTSISIPPNIAPLNFSIKEPAERYIARFYNSEKTDFLVSSGDGTIDIPEKKWKELLKDSHPGNFSIDIFIRKSGKWQKYNTITNIVTADSVDKFLVYRLIEPGFETWNKMGIYQRDLENFRETPVMLNTFADGKCINCHSFCKNSNDRMMFHIRGANGGTIVFEKGRLLKINTKTKSTISAGVYPAWHPSGNQIAYSVNNIVQSFHAIPGKKIEVLDTLSDIVVYDLRKNLITKSRFLSDPGQLETFPAWSPDGSYLYFCSAKKEPPSRYDQIRYDLFRAAFDTVSGTFGKPDTIISVSRSGKSISFPRLSPDGRYILFCMSDYGNFSIWHPESDLWLLDLKTGKISSPEINSNKSESYHAWSSNGRWIVFSSRREDGLFTRPYFSYFDTEGRAHKPFILPQEDPHFYPELMKSFNIPELVRKKIDLDPGKLYDVAKSVPVDALDSMQ
jgi:hypothetical protein